MIVYDDISLTEFRGWAGGADNLGSLSNQQINTVENIIDELYPNGISKTALNDLFWFDFDTVCEWLGIRPKDELEDEIAEKQAELDDLMAQFEDAFAEDSEDMTKDEFFDYYYSDEVDDIKEEIEELKEELSEWE